MPGLSGTVIHLGRYKAVSNKEDFVDCFQQNPTISNLIGCYISEGFGLIDKPEKCLSPSVYFSLWLIQAGISTLAALGGIFPAVQILEDEALSTTTSSNTNLRC